MSQKSTIFCKATFITIMFICLQVIVACSPCRQLAELMCECQPEESRRQCLSDLSLASQHEYFSRTFTPGVCEEALKKCGSCLKINNLQDEECGQYRLKRKK